MIDREKYRKFNAEIPDEVKSCISRHLHTSEFEKVINDFDQLYIYEKILDECYREKWMDIVSYIKFPM